MNTKVLIFDLDNTVYPVSSIADKLFPPVLRLIAESGEQDASLQEIEKDLMRKPFEYISAKHGFSEKLKEKGVQLLRNMTYDGPIEPNPDFAQVHSLPGHKILVTAGYPKLQHSKIRGMQLEKFFSEIHVIDIGTMTKKDMFEDILKRHAYQPNEMLAIGDDPDSEIKAALELRANAVLYDKIGLFPDFALCPRITDFGELGRYVS